VTPPGCVAAYIDQPELPYRQGFTRGMILGIRRNIVGGYLLSPNEDAHNLPALRYVYRSLVRHSSSIRVVVRGPYGLGSRLLLILRLGK
jgi:hypothetical protein